jgi:hypothetical protein
MSHPQYLRDRARALRASHKFTIDELAERLALPRSTIYYWVRDLPIPGSGPGGGWPQNAQRMGSIAMKRKYRRLREAAYREGVASFDRLCEDPTFRDFVALYIGEGYKRSRHCVAICNSDPAVMRLAVGWIRRLTDRPPVCSIQYHVDQDLRELRRFWGLALNVDPASIRFQRKSNSGQLQGRIWRSRHGVLTLRVCDTYLRARLQGWMDEIRAGWQ